MLVLGEIQKCFNNDRSIKYFPDLLRNLRYLHVTGFVHFLPYGNLTFYSENHNVQMMRGEKEYVHVSSVVDIFSFKCTLYEYFNDSISYKLFCQKVAGAGICKWNVDLIAGEISFISAGYECVLTLDISIYTETKTSEISFLKESLDQICS